MRTKNKQNAIRDNIKKHDSIVHRYEKKHPEIFNKTEQRRLSGEINHTVTHVRTSNHRKNIVALDIGCGTGNIIKHLLDHDIQVIGADVSTGFFEILKKKYDGFIKSQKLTLKQINGEDLRDFSNGSIDIITCYSVLHHIPDYLGMVSEMLRVLKPNGVLFIDHEKNDFFWSNQVKIRNFLLQNRKEKSMYSKILLVLNPHTYWKLSKQKVRAKFFPYYQPEGDIHVYYNDHIELKHIKKVAKNSDSVLLEHKNYLAYQPRYLPHVYEKYKNDISDTMLIKIQKK